MGYPIHPNRGALDLDYSVLYDDFDPLAARAVINDLDKVVPLPEPPEFTYSVVVKYEATNGGTL